jgi:hypothetical protein
VNDEIESAFANWSLAGFHFVVKLIVRDDATSNVLHTRTNVS